MFENLSPQTPAGYGPGFKKTNLPMLFKILIVLPLLMKCACLVTSVIMQKQKI